MSATAALNSLPPIGRPQHFESRPHLFGVKCRSLHYDAARSQEVTTCGPHPTRHACRSVMKSQSNPGCKRGGSVDPTVGPTSSLARRHGCIIDPWPTR